MIIDCTNVAAESGAKPAIIAALKDARANLLDELNSVDELLAQLGAHDENNAVEFDEHGNITAIWF